MLPLLHSSLKRREGRARGCACTRAGGLMALLALSGVILTVYMGRTNGVLGAMGVVPIFGTCVSSRPRIPPTINPEEPAFRNATCTPLPPMEEVPPFRAENEEEGGAAESTPPPPSLSAEENEKRLALEQARRVDIPSSAAGMLSDGGVPFNSTPPSPMKHPSRWVGLEFGFGEEDEDSDEEEEDPLAKEFQKMRLKESNGKRKKNLEDEKKKIMDRVATYIEKMAQGDGLAGEELREAEKELNDAEERLLRLGDAEKDSKDGAEKDGLFAEKDESRAEKDESRAEKDDDDTSTGDRQALEADAEKERKKKRREHIKFLDPKAEKDRKTLDGVLDARTNKMITKLQKQGWFDKIGGSIKSGKESNVFRAYGGPHDSGNVAIKVFRTSVMPFNRRKAYLRGDRRMDKQHIKPSNAGKMVKVWAEKEYRNLHLLRRAQVPCPQPYAINGHVLVMEFLDNEPNCHYGPAPRLVDMDIETDDMFYIYIDIALSIWKMFVRAKLVHGDLSEYNILFSQNRPMIIDVGQAVQLSHPEAYEFLRRDIQTVHKYFQKLGVKTLTDKQLFLLATNFKESDEIALLQEIKDKSVVWSKQHLKENEYFSWTIIADSVDKLPFEANMETVEELTNKYRALDPDITDRMLAMKHWAHQHSKLLDNETLLDHSRQLFEEFVGLSDDNDTDSVGGSLDINQGGIPGFSGEISNKYREILETASLKSPEFTPRVSGESPPMPDGVVSDESPRVVPGETPGIPDGISGKSPEDARDSDDSDDDDDDDDDDDFAGGWKELRKEVEEGGLNFTSEALQEALQDAIQNMNQSEIDGLAEEFEGMETNEPDSVEMKKAISELKEYFANTNVPRPPGGRAENDTDEEDAEKKEEEGEEANAEKDGGGGASAEKDGSSRAEKEVASLNAEKDYGANREAKGPVEIPIQIHKNVNGISGRADPSHQRSRDSPHIREIPIERKFSAAATSPRSSNTNAARGTPQQAHASYGDDYEDVKTIEGEKNERKKEEAEEKEEEEEENLDKMKEEQKNQKKTKSARDLEEARTTRKKKTKKKKKNQKKKADDGYRFVPTPSPTMPRKIRRHHHVLMMDRINWTDVAIRDQNQARANQKLLEEQMENEEMFMRALAQREPEAMLGEPSDSLTVESDTDTEREEEEEEEEEEDDEDADASRGHRRGYVFQEAHTYRVMTQEDGTIQDETLDITTLTSSRASYRKPIKPSDEDLEAERREKKLQRAAVKEARRQRRKEKKENKKRSWKKRKKEQKLKEREIIITGV